MFNDIKTSKELIFYKLVAVFTLVNEIETWVKEVKIVGKNDADKMKFL
jgi:hypothetical protein